MADVPSQMWAWSHNNVMVINYIGSRGYTAIKVADVGMSVCLNDTAHTGVRYGCLSSRVKGGA